jgi:acyl-CoA synthetase (AMP-forming)/AMP-acid ligase II
MSSQDPASEALIAHCKSLIAGYKCPRSIDFVEALPLSGAVKVSFASIFSSLANRRSSQ